MNIFAHVSWLPTVLLIGCLLTAGGCSRRSETDVPMVTYPIGTQAPATPLIYTVVDTEWLAELDTGNGPRLPKHRFLSVNLTVTNGGGAQTGIPLLSVVDSNGQTYMEESQGDGLPQWLGYLRLIEAAGTEQGRILFDVPPGAYKLRVSSGGDPEQEKAALVEIPFSPAHSPTAGAGQPTAPPGPTTPINTKLK